MNIPTWDFLVGMVVFLLMSLVNTPPRVSIPRERGVTSSKRTSVTSPASTPPRKKIRKINQTKKKFLSILSFTLQFSAPFTKRRTKVPINDQTYLYEIKSLGLHYFNKKRIRVRNIWLHISLSMIVDWRT